jgi:hypothetical protein
VPTNHGFEEFFGNLYHLNAEEEPENPAYPKTPEFKKKFGPRGVIHSFAGGKIEDTGPLTKKRMETVDEEVTAAALKFLDKAHEDGEGLKVWQQPFEGLRAPLLTNLRMDPFERAYAEDATGCQRWYLERMFAMAPAGGYMGQWLQSFREFPPRRKPGSFNLDRVMEAVQRGAGDKQACDDGMNEGPTDCRTKGRASQ